jgi:NADH-quinone oxidoreductase subunit N
MTIIMLGMSGMPFFAGFVGKLLAFVAVADAGYLWLVIVGALTTVIGLAFYLRVVATMFRADDSDDLATLEVSLTSRIALIIAATATFAFGVVPWPLLDVVKDALPL